MHTYSCSGDRQSLNNKIIRTTSDRERESATSAHVYFCAYLYKEGRMHEA